MSRPEWLRTFLAIYRAGSVAEAARLRGLSQPATSQQLAALERAARQAGPQVAPTLVSLRRTAAQLRTLAAQLNATAVAARRSSGSAVIASGSLFAGFAMRTFSPLDRWPTAYPRVRHECVVQGFSLP